MKEHFINYKIVLYKFIKRTFGSHKNFSLELMNRVDIECLKLKVIHFTSFNPHKLDALKQTLDASL